MDPKEAARQMYQAYDEFSKGSTYELTNIDYYIQESNMDEQPNYYENTEFKDIPFDKIVQKGTSEFTYFKAGGH
jgi:hypothetical protein